MTTPQPRLRAVKTSSKGKASPPIGESRPRIPSMSGTLYLDPVEHVVFRMAGSEDEGESTREILAPLPEVSEVITKRGGPGQGLQVSYRLRNPDTGASLVVADDDDVIKGRWAPMLGMVLSADRRIVDAACTAIRMLGAKAPAVPGAAQFEGDRFQLPSADVGPTGYGETKGDEASARKAWHEAGAIVARNPKVALTCGTALGGLFLDALRRKPFVHHLTGVSSKGKSTALFAAGAIYGNPETVVATFNATGLALTENGDYGCYPAMTDELGTAGLSSDQTTSLVFRLTGGTGRRRMSRTGARQQSAPWRAPFISTGNISLLDVTNSEGIPARVVELEATDHDPVTADAQSAERLEALTDGAHGWPLRWLMESPRMEDMRAAVEQAERDLGIDELGGVLRRLCKHVALSVAGAGRLGDIIGVPGVRDAALSAARAVLGEADYRSADDATHTRVLRIIREGLATGHIQSISELPRGFDQLPVGMIGWHDSERLYAVPGPTTDYVRRASAAQGRTIDLTPTGMGKALRDAGVTRCTESRDVNGNTVKRTTHRVKITGKARTVWDLPLEDAEQAPPPPPPPAPEPTPEPGPVADTFEPDRDGSGALLRGEVASCIVCGTETVYLSAGRPCHPHGMCADNGPDKAPEQAPAPASESPRIPSPAEQDPAPEPSRAEQAPEQTSIAVTYPAIVVTADAVTLPTGPGGPLAEDMDLTAMLDMLSVGPAGESTVVLVDQDVTKRLGLTGRKPAQGKPWHRAFTGPHTAGWHAEGRPGERPHVGPWTQLEHSERGVVRLCVAPWLSTGEAFPFTGDEIREGALPDAGEVIRRVTAFTSHTGTSYRGTAANTAVTMFRDALASTARRSPRWRGTAPITDTPLTWIHTREPRQDERARAWVHSYDMSRNYLAPTREARLVMDDLRHTGFIKWDGSLGGLFRIMVPEWPWAELPAPTSQAPGTLAWVTAPVVKEYARLGLPVTIEESWSGRASQPKGSRAFVDTVRAATDALTAPDDAAILDAVKGLYRTLHGKLRATPSRIQRPDWGLTIRDEAWCNVLRKAYATAGITTAEDVPTGPTPLHVDMDELAYASDVADPYTAAKALPGVNLPEPGERPRLGQFRAKKTTPMTEWLSQQGEK